MTLATSQPWLPKVWISMGWIALYFALQIVATMTAVLVAMGLGAKSPLESPVSLLWGIIIAGVLLLGLLWAYLRTDRRMARLGLLDFGQMPWLRVLALAVPLIGSTYAFNALYATYVIPGIDMQKEITELIKNIPRTPLNIFLGFTAIAVLAPLVEELLFRGLLQNTLMRYLPSYAAIALSALVFALIHLQPYAIPPLMALGAAFGYLYHKTGSLRITILLHGINNAMALLLI